MNPKPIFVIVFPRVDKHLLNKLSNYICDKLPDYNAIVLSDDRKKSSDVICNLYSINNATDIDIDNFKKEITTKLNELSK